MGHILVCFVFLAVAAGAAEFAYRRGWFDGYLENAYNNRSVLDLIKEDEEG